MKRPTILASPMTVVVTADVILIMALWMTLYASALAEVTCNNRFENRLCLMEVKRQCFVTYSLLHYITCFSYWCFSYS